MDDRQERRPFADDIPELEWERDGDLWVAELPECRIWRGLSETPMDAALVRAGIRIGLERAKKHGRKTPRQVKRYRAKLMLQRRWWRATKRALHKVMLQRDAAMKGANDGE